MLLLHVIDPFSILDLSASGAFNAAQLFPKNSVAMMKASYSVLYPMIQL